MLHSSTVYDRMTVLGLEVGKRHLKDKLKAAIIKSGFYQKTTVPIYLYFYSPREKHFPRSVFVNVTMLLQNGREIGYIEKRVDPEAWNNRDQPVLVTHHNRHSGRSGRVDQTHTTLFSNDYPTFSKEVTDSFIASMISLCRLQDLIK